MPYVNIPTLPDWQYDEATKKIRHNTGTARVTANQLYSAIMALVDDETFMDSDPPMEANTPTEYELIDGWTMASDSDFGFITGGSIKVTATDDLWAAFYNLGTLKAGTVLYIEQNGQLVPSPPGYASGDIDVLVKVRSAGVDIDSRKVTLYARNLGDTYDVFTIAAPATGGYNPVPISTSADTNDDPATASDGGITITFGATNQDIGDGAGNQPYAVSVNANGLSTLAAYRALKYRLRRQNSAAIGTGDATNGRFYRLANPGFEETKNSPFGRYAGGKFFGAQGVWLTNVADPNSRELIDSNGAVRTPPVSMVVTVNGVAAGDRVLVARATSGVINKNQLTIASTAAATLTAVEALGADIPAAGTLVIGDSRFTYTGRNLATKTFTGVSPTPAGKTGGFYIPLIDTVVGEAQTSVTSPSMIYASDFEVDARVRKKGIKAFRNSAIVNNTGAVISAIRTIDRIVT